MVADVREWTVTEGPFIVLQSSGMQMLHNHTIIPEISVVSSFFLSVILSVPKFCSEIRFPRKSFARFGSNSTNVLPRNLRCAF